MNELKHGGCVSCWRHAVWLTHLYTRRDGQPITKVGIYRERHAQHQSRIRDGLSWEPHEPKAWRP